MEIKRYREPSNDIEKQEQKTIWADGRSAFEHRLECEQKIEQENNRVASEVKWVENIVRRVIAEMQQKEMDERY